MPGGGREITRQSGWGRHPGQAPSGCGAAGGEDAHGVPVAGMLAAGGDGGFAVGRRPGPSCSTATGIAGPAADDDEPVFLPRCQVAERLRSRRPPHATGNLRRQPVGMSPDANWRWRPASRPAEPRRCRVQVRRSAWRGCPRRPFCVRAVGGGVSASNARAKASATASNNGRAGAAPQKSRSASLRHYNRMYYSTPG